MAAPTAPRGCRASRRRSGRGPERPTALSAPSPAATRHRVQPGPRRPVPVTPPAHRSFREPRRPSRPILLLDGAPRRRGPAPRPDRATARHPPGRSAAAARPPRRASSAPPGRQRSDPAPTLDLPRTPSATHRAAGPGVARGDPASAPPTDATRRRRAPSPTEHQRPALHGSPTPARPCTPTTPSCPRPVRPAPPMPGSHPPEQLRSARRGRCTRGAGPSAVLRALGSGNVSPSARQRRYKAYRPAATASHWRMRACPASRHPQGMRAKAVLAFIAEGSSVMTNTPR